MQFDEHELKDLLEESKDIHTDAMRESDELLDEFVETGLEQRVHKEIDPEECGEFTAKRTEALKQGLVGVGAAAGIGTAFLALSETASFAATATDIQILQTNQSIENIAINTYTLALTLPFIGGSSANAVVKAFATETLAQHKQHDDAFGSAIRRLHGKPQSAADPVLTKLVNKAKPTLTSPGAVVALALELEDGAAQTYIASVAALRNSNARKVTASIMGVEAQHAAVLRAVQALLNANDASLIALPPSPLTSLPAAAGSVGFPHAFYPTSSARPETEGAVR